MANLPKTIQDALQALDDACDAQPGYGVAGGLCLSFGEVSGSRKQFGQIIPFRSDHLTKSDAVGILQHTIKVLIDG